jgi:hypothetical protein
MYNILAKRVAQLHPQALDSLFIAFYNSHSCRKCSNPPPHGNVNNKCSKIKFYGRSKQSEVDNLCDIGLTRNFIIYTDRLVILTRQQDLGTQLKWKMEEMYSYIGLWGAC